jgi:hypothetical protein
MLLSRLDDQFDAIDLKDLSIVTFNYDRSVEHLFCEALCSRHNMQPSEVAQKNPTSESSTSMVMWDRLIGSVLPGASIGATLLPTKFEKPLRESG